ncbi:hypothetical protein GCM10011507_16210 [Edaphobacter acidisoli]|uniref:Uncharacterized protein n=1 Tax=Edaphobacter acidisoli TaxID=2040573 RepID=A0A916W4R2_9BACT|nr:hypothetical protein [Edaphobacter acidisoli]GGA65392.1 hypothetical protein GCM10011507_16210 [Edaphobacter acidisoli]
MALMAKKSSHRTFNDVLSLLGSQRFDVAPAQEGAKRTPNAFQVRKYGCAAEIAAAPDGTVVMLVRPGFVLGGEISRLLDRGYQKFLKTSKVEIPATADHLRALHEFSEELNEAAGATSLYNQALGTTSDVYNYDRVKGRE